MKFLIFLLLMTTNVLAYDTYEYLVYREHFPQDRYRISESGIEPTYRNFTMSGATDIDKAGGQPFRMTNYRKNYDGKYGVISITPVKDSEKNLFKSMAGRGFIKLLRVNKIISVKNNRGGYDTEMDIKTYDKLPADFYEVYEIGVSSK